MRLDEELVSLRQHVQLVFLDGFKFLDVDKEAELIKTTIHVRTEIGRSGYAALITAKFTKWEGKEGVFPPQSAT